MMRAGHTIERLSTTVLVLLGLVFGLAEAAGQAAIRDWLASLHQAPVPIGDVPRIASTLSHPNVAAVVLELSLPLLVAWTWTARGAWRVFLVLAASSTLLAIVLT